MILQYFNETLLTKCNVKSHSRYCEVKLQFLESNSLELHFGNKLPLKYANVIFYCIIVLNQILRPQSYIPLQDCEIITNIFDSVCVRNDPAGSG